MAVIGFDLKAFYAAFPAFQQTPAQRLNEYWNMATGFISNQVWGCRGNVARQTQYLNLMTAHLAAINDMIASGQTPGVVIQATIDKISVTMQPPPEKDQFQWWLNTTPYGQQLLVMLQMNSVGGWFIGGSPVRAGFRGGSGRRGW